MLRHPRNLSNFIDTDIGVGDIILHCGANIHHIAHQHHGADMPRQISDPRHRLQFLFRRNVEIVQQLAAHRHPKSRRVHLPLRQLQIPGPHILVGEKFQFFEAHHLRKHMHIAIIETVAIMRRIIEHIQHSDLGISNGVGVIIGIGPAHKRLAILEIKFFHNVLLPFQNINGFGMQRLESR